MQQNRGTIINRIYYLAYKYRIRNMEFLWNDQPFDPSKPEDQKILESSSLEVLSQILDKYLEAKDIIYKQDDSFVYRHFYKKTQPKFD